MPYTYNPFVGDLDYYKKPGVLSGTITDHGYLAGLLDDDHPQYHNDKRGDDRYYTEIELDAGQLDNRYYTENEVDDLITAVSGEFGDHSKLSNLDYEFSGHTGFQPAGDYVTSTELTTISGDLQTNIDGKSDIDHSHTESDILDLDKYTKAEVDTISGSLQTSINGKADYNHTHDDRYYTETELDAGQLDNRYYTELEIDTISGALQSIQINAIPNLNQSAEGPKCNNINAGETITIMDCVYLESDGEWRRTSANDKTTSAGMLAIALESKTDGQPMNVALPGCFIRNDSWTWTIGGNNSGIIYLSCTSGTLTQVTVSGTDNVVRIVGHATHANRMFFNPEQTIVVHS